MTNDVILLETGSVTKGADPQAVIERWAEHLRLEYAAATRGAYLKGLRLFRAFLADRAIAFTTATPTDIVAWRESLKAEYAAQTVNLWLTAVRRFYAWLLEQGAPIVNPAAGVRGATRRGQTRRHRRDELTTREVARVLAACPETPQGRRDRAILSLMAYCALRTVEIHRADVADLRTKDDRLVLWVRGKGHSEADDFVVIPGPAEDTLRGWLAVRGDRPGPIFTSMSNRSRGRRLGLRAIRAMAKRRYQAAGVTGERKTTHSLRHSAISNAIRNGATPLQAQAMARHKSFDTTMLYYHEVGRTTNPAEDLISYTAGGV